MGKRLWACFLTVLLLVTVWAVPIWGADGESLDEALQGIVTYYEDNKTDLDNWEEVVGLSEAGVDLSAGPWGLPDWDIDALDQDSYPADYATIILGMWAAGEDPMDAGGRDLTAELADLQDEDGNFGTRLHDTIWSMVALDRAGASYDTAAASAYLLAQQTSDGGWALGGDSADPDMTGFALIALGSHQDEDGVRNGINAALYCLQDLQLDSGGFSSGIENTESIASVIRGLVACDEDIIGEDWIKTDQTMIDALFAFQLEDYSFAHGEGGSSNAMATRQALIAVADMVNAGIDYTIGGGGDGGDDPEEATVRVRVEGAADELLDAEVDVAGSALDALVAAAGAGNVTAPGGFVSEILGESGQNNVAPGIDTSWFYYVVRDGGIEPNAFDYGPDGYPVEDGDEVIFYIGAYDSSTWAGKTYLPVVSVSPDNPTAGGSLTISITAWKYDWMTGLQELSDDEKTAIGEYTVTAAGDEYTSSGGQVTIDDLTAGTLDYQISNAGEYGYPDVVACKGSVTVEEDTQSPTQTDYITVKIAVVGGAGNLLYGPREVKVYDSDEYGYTAMGALDATGLSWTMSNSADGFITEIGGEENEGMNGWMYSINGTNPSDVPMYEDVEDGDKVIFWYSMDITEDGPSWDDVLDLSDNPPSHPEGLREAKLIFSRYEYELKSLKKESEVWNQENRLSPSELKRLKKMLDGNRVDFTGDIDEEGGYLVDSDDMEVAILVPENAVDRSLTITIEELAAGEAQQQIGIKILSSVYEFGPSPLEFNKPVTICFKVAIDEDVDLDSLTPAWWDEANQKWVPIPAIIDLEYGLVIFRVDHFSQYALLSIGPVPAAAAPRVTFPDVGEDMAWARDAIEILAGQGIIMGTDAGLFEPHRPITRAEFIQIIANARGLEPSTGLDGIFSDVYPVDWFAPAVVAAFNNRIVTGSPDGTFKPGQEISRAEVAVIFANMSPETVIDQIAGLSYQDIHTIPTWAFRAVKFTHQQGLMSGYEDGTFRGNGPLTRAEAAVIMYNYLNLIAADQ